MIEHPENDTGRQPEPEPATTAEAVSGADDLAGFEADLDTVAASLDALDGEDLERAESLAASLDDPGAESGS